MKPNTLALFLLCNCFLAHPAFAGLPFYYSAEAIEARVIDADTKKPLVGVIVTANWQLEEGTLGGSISAGQLMVMEAITDKDGKFSFPAWGPKLAVTSHLVNQDPQLLLFKSGYEYRRLYNEYSGDLALRTRNIRRSDWNGKTIELKLFKGTMKDYAFKSSIFGTYLYNIIADCEWKKIPRMILVLDKERERLESIQPGLSGSLPNIDSVEGFRAKCGAGKEYFREYAK